MKVTIKIVCILVCFSALSKEAFCQSNQCGTPIECYEKSLQNLQQARMEIVGLAKTIQALQAQLENLGNANTKLKEELTKSEARLESELRNINDRVTVSQKIKFSGSTSAAGGAEDYLDVTFPFQFKDAPVVVVTHEVPNFHPFADGFVTISMVSASGFRVQRRNVYSQVWNDPRVTLHYIAVGHR